MGFMNLGMEQSGCDPKANNAKMVPLQQQPGVY